MGHPVYCPELVIFRITKYLLNNEIGIFCLKEKYLLLKFGKNKTIQNSPNGHLKNPQSMRANVDTKQTSKILIQMTQVGCGSGGNNMKPKQN